MFDFVTQLNFFHEKKSFAATHFSNFLFFLAMRSKQAELRTKEEKKPEKLSSDDRLSSSDFEDEARALAPVKIKNDKQFAADSESDEKPAPKKKPAKKTTKHTDGQKKD